MITIVLKYKKFFLIILLLCILWVIKHHRVIVWNSMRFMKNGEVVVLVLIGIEYNLY